MLGLRHNIPSMNSLSDILDTKGLHTGATNHSREEYLRCMVSNFDHFMKPGAFSRQRYDLVMKAKNYQTEYFSSLLSCSSDSSFINSLVDNGFYHSSSYFSYDLISLLCRISKLSMLWASKNCFLRYKNPCISQWPVHPDLIEDLLYALSGTIVSQIPLLSGFRLENIGFNASENIPNPLSTQWHRDSAGNVLKVFIILFASDVDCVRTGFIPGSHKDSSHSKNVDLLRTKSEFACDWEMQSLLTLCLSEYYRSTALQPLVTPRDLIIFDTNSYHRAYIPSSFDHTSCKRGFRVKLEMQFMRKDSSDFNLFNLLGPCAPGLQPVFVRNTNSSILSSWGFDNSCFVSSPDLDHHFLYCHPFRIRQGQAPTKSLS